ncbi:hypothetical protein C8J57DRAFT_1514988 [Mycena rebaudengoi]|nr:hypothetical protein C8J57DRAFT_1514988 [Mycena rebaudengoi]
MLDRLLARSSTRALTVVDDYCSKVHKMYAFLPRRALGAFNAIMDRQLLPRLVHLHVQQLGGGEPREMKFRSAPLLAAMHVEHAFCDPRGHEGSALRSVRLVEVPYPNIPPSLMRNLHDLAIVRTSLPSYSQIPSQMANLTSLTLDDPLDSRMCLQPFLASLTMPRLTRLEVVRLNEYSSVEPTHAFDAPIRFPALRALTLASLALVGITSNFRLVTLALCDVDPELLFSLLQDYPSLFPALRAVSVDGADRSAVPVVPKVTRSSLVVVIVKGVWRRNRRLPPHTRGEVYFFPNTHWSAKSSSWRWDKAKRRAVADSPSSFKSSSCFVLPQHTLEREVVLVALGQSKAPCGGRFTVKLQEQQLRPWSDQGEWLQFHRARRRLSHPNTELAIVALGREDPVLPYVESNRVAINKGTQTNGHARWKASFFHRRIAVATWWHGPSFGLGAAGASQQSISAVAYFADALQVAEAPMLVARRVAWLAREIRDMSRGRVRGAGRHGACFSPRYRQEEEQHGTDGELGRALPGPCLVGHGVVVRACPLLNLKYRVAVPDVVEVCSPIKALPYMLNLLNVRSESPTSSTRPRPRWSGTLPSSFSPLLLLPPPPSPSIFLPSSLPSSSSPPLLCTRPSALLFISFSIFSFHYDPAANTPQAGSPFPVTFIAARTDRFDWQLMIAQMQGRWSLAAWATLLCFAFPVFWDATVTSPPSVPQVATHIPSPLPRPIASSPSRDADPIVFATPTYIPLPARSLPPLLRTPSIDVPAPSYTHLPLALSSHPLNNQTHLLLQDPTHAAELLLEF